MQPEPSALATLGWIARGRAIALKTNAADARDWMTANGAPTRAKAAVGAANLGDSDLGDYGVSTGAWDALRTQSVFARILSDGGFVRAPANTRVGITTVPATGSVVGEGHAVPLSRLTLQNLLLQPLKASALVVLTDELLRNVGSSSQMLLNSQLAGAVSDVVDGAFLNALVSTATTEIVSAGTSAVNAKHDLRSALLAVNSVGPAKLYWVCAVDVAKKASTLADTAGGDAFVAMSATGGELANLPAIVSSGVPSGSLFLLDASGVAADGGPITVDTSTQADISMLDNPTMDATVPTGAQMVSLFQSNSTAIRATAWFAAEALRDDCLAQISGIDWGA